MSKFKIWEHRLKIDGKTEPKKAFNLFQDYLLLGKGRDLKTVAENNGRKLYYIQRLSSRWNWTDRVNAYDTHLIEENKREFEEETRERYKLANKVSLQALKILNEFIEEGNLLDEDLNLKNVKIAGDLGAKLVKNESAIELDTNIHEDVSPYDIREALGILPDEDEEESTVSDGEE